VEVTAGIPVHAADLIALMNRKELDRVVLIGRSLGAMIGVYLAANHPARVSRLVLIDGGSDVTDEVDALLAPVVERLERTYLSREAYVEYLKSLPVFEDRWDENLERYFAGDVRPGGGEWLHHADLETIRDDRGKMHGYPLCDLWSCIGCPTLVLLSTVGLARPNAGFVRSPQDARRMQRIIPDCALVEVENTNHYDILYSAPRTTVEAIKGFLTTFEGM
jgi:pimeloyl-ACP methyl ester carboxylesterase